MFGQVYSERRKEQDRLENETSKQQHLVQVQQRQKDAEAYMNDEIRQRAELGWDVRPMERNRKKNLMSLHLRSVTVVSIIQSLIPVFHECRFSERSLSGGRNLQERSWQPKIESAFPYITAFYNMCHQSWRMDENYHCQKSSARLKPIEPNTVLHLPEICGFNITFYNRRNFHRVIAGRLRQIHHFFFRSIGNSANSKRSAGWQLLHCHGIPSANGVCWET